MISVQSLRVEFGPRVLFSNLSFSVQPRERIAFAGHNGAGKSTLMKCIAGIIPPSGGLITAPKGTKIGYLPQEGIHVKGRTLWQETQSAFGEIMAIKEKVDRLSDELVKMDPRSSPYGDLLEEIGELELKLYANDPELMKPKIESVLKGLGFSEKDFKRDCSEFSGGWQMRIAMAKLFLQQPEVLLLDEPTNHLDIETQIWVEQYLVNYPGAILLISHDRALLDTLCTRTIAFAHGRAEEYAGNFSYFERESVLRKEIQLKQYTAQQREIAESQRFIDRFRASANKATLVQSRIKLLAKVVRIPKPERDDAVMNFKFPPPPNSGHTVAKLENVSKAYGPLRIFNGFDFEINKGEKFAIVGPNGAGKSTFCRLVTKQEEADAGSIELGHKVAPSFFSQNHADELDPDLTILETVQAVASRDAMPQVRNILGCFLFTGDDVFKKIGVLSGGERSRVALTCMLAETGQLPHPRRADKPPRHAVPGSPPARPVGLSGHRHDRLPQPRFPRRPRHQNPRIPPRRGTPPLPREHRLLSRQERQRGRPVRDKQAPSNTSAAEVTKAAPKQQSTPGINRKEQRKLEAQAREARTKVLAPLEKELASLEEKIAEQEAAQATLTTALSSPEISEDSDKLRQTTNAVEKITKALDLAYTRWSSLTEEIEKVKAKHNLE